MENILVTPITTEKAYAQSQKNVYVFAVPLTANRDQISRAVEAQYGVKVVATKVLVQSGKTVRFSRGKNRYPGQTKRADRKKAYVTLAAGNSIAVFEQPADETKEEKK